jgi:uncharacterized protein (DUF1697 family)
MTISFHQHGYMIYIQFFQIRKYFLIFLSSKTIFTAMCYQSGNIIFRSKTSDLNTLEERIVSGIAARFSLSVPVLLLDSRQLAAILSNCPFPDDGISKPVGVYISLMSALPEERGFPAIDGKTAPTERCKIIDRCLFLNCPKGYGKTRITNEFIEKSLKVVSTTRNIRTMRKLAAIAESLNAPDR